MVPKDDEDSMGTPQELYKTLKGLSGLLSRLCKVHEESMRSPWERVGDCKIQRDGVNIGLSSDLD